jgi:hypothetical protein
MFLPGLRSPLSAAALILISTISAEAACPGTIARGETETTGQVLTNQENCTIQQGGAISTSNDFENGIDAGNTNTITNDGSISTQGAIANGIRAGDGNTITNRGLIDTDRSEGIFAGDGNTVTNAGIIVSNDDDGIRVDDGNTVVHSGSIQSGALALRVDDGNTVTSSGLIQAARVGIQLGDNNTLDFTNAITSGGRGIEMENGNIVSSRGSIVVTQVPANDAFGIEADSNNTITHTGSISVTGVNGGGDVHGIQAFANNTITHAGSVSVTGVAGGGTAYGVELFTDNVLISNGAIIARGPDAFAIRFVNQNTATLEQNSLIVGLLNMSGGTDTVNLGRGENWLITFDAVNGLAENLNTYGRPTAIINGGLTVATFDTAATVFGFEDEALSDLTGAINATLQHRLTAGNPATYFWMQGIGGTRNADEAGGPGYLLAEDQIRLGGMMGGFSLPLTSWARGGLFGGYAELDLNGAVSPHAGIRSHEIDQESWFGGAYARAFMGNMFADIIFTGGDTQSESRRRVLNNLALNGVDVATASYDGWFVNSAMTLGVEIPAGDGSKLVPSFSVGYAGMFLGGMAEQGSLAAVSLSGRDVEIIDSRLQLELRNAGSTELGSWQTAIRAGLKGRASIGDEALSGVLATTTAFNVALEGDDDAIGGFAGGDITYAVAPNIHFYAGGEAGIETNADIVLTGRVGGSVKF